MLSRQEAGRLLWVGWGCLLVWGLLPVSTGLGQAGLRDSLERLDRNRNGEIDTHEITSLARPWLERVGEARNLSLDRSHSIEKWQEAARAYHAINNGVAGRRVRPTSQSSVKSFEPDPDRPLVPEFGLPEVKYPYIQDDLDEADRTLRRLDRNRNGYLDHEEVLRGRWTHRDPFAEDYDRDGRLSRLELAQRYARRRILDDSADELMQKRRRVGSEVRPSRSDDDDRSRRWRGRDPRYYLTSTVLSRFDTNRNGRLEAAEAMRLGVPMGRVDTNRDGELSREELHAYLAEMQDAAISETEGLPAWFFELDVNRDKQVAMSEFAEVWTEEKVQEFAALDQNGDGLLTVSEVVLSSAVAGGTFTNETAEVLPPKQTVISEIVVDETFRVADLDVQLSITHTSLSMLDAFLVGPDGQRVELFTAVGGHDDHFDQTVFDDQADTPITKARPPFRGKFQPEALQKRQPSLTHFNGQSVEGVWQLVISGTRNERFGMLHRWALIVRPMEESYSDPVRRGLIDPEDASPEADQARARQDEANAERY
ncbi:proprotein convertase P-domain-containing protein [Roseimaritima sediminicola]|uniref:proprotein convertase P-domain-containing protein n=1 Tax=Roseimaritima sediminicola TaxID=2662066 RepID=UPI0012982983|nr:proprotein convertase P-domain-containing protein [Roseimaritima sediminicola]